MQMHWIDWSIVVALMVVVTCVSLGTRKYTKSVADFLAANRCAGRYVLCIANDLAGVGAISFIASFEMYYKAGFVATWWGLMAIPLWLLITLSGWLIYRFRETRAMTMPQFIEMRYSRRFRVFFGILGWLSGVLAVGIMPAVGARFFIFFCGLPQTFSMFGINLSTYPLVMLVLMAVAMFFTFVGGQISVIATDFVQGMFCNVAFLLLLGALLWKFPWHGIVETMKLAPHNASLLNPYHTGEVQDFNLSFFLIQQAVAAYMYRTFQGSQGFNSSARSPHEAQMAGVLGTWRGFVQSILIMMIPICAYVVMHDPTHAATAADVQSRLAAIDNPQIRTQMTVPVVMSRVLPVGFVGMLCAVMLAAAVSSQGTCIHSFGGIFLQDIVMPLRREPFEPRQHMRLLRLSIVAVGAFLFFFSLLFRQVDYIYMFVAIASALFCGAGAALIGGLYWKRGTTGGAWAGMFAGLTVALLGITLQQTWSRLLPALREAIPQWAYLQHASAEKFPINGMMINFIAMLAAIAAYVGGSLVSGVVLRRPAFDMDRMFHRTEPEVTDAPQPGRFLRALGLSNEFTRGDKIIFWATFVWIIGWFIAFVVATIYNLVGGVSDDAWASFWLFKLWLTVILGVGTTVWFFIGGVRDMRAMYRTLRTASRDDQDDGTVATPLAIEPSPEEALVEVE